MKNKITGHTPGPWTSIQDAKGGWIYAGPQTNDNRLAAVERNIQGNTALIAAIRAGTEAQP